MRKLGQTADNQTTGTILQCIKYIYNIEKELNWGFSNKSVDESLSEVDAIKPNEERTMRA